jgi:Coproporphyrinogen III oxidase and related Fe-S oxidoreductases
MNRAHNNKEAENALELCKQFNFELSIDLIYGLPNLTVAQWKENLDKALAYRPAHISAYCLTVEEKTLLYKQVQRGDVTISSNENQAAQFDLLINTLAVNGYEQYEISNFARNNKYAKHNTNYWLGKAYLGIGPSAHSYNGKSRSYTVKNNTSYINCINQGKNCITEEQLTAKDIFNETFLTGLRTKWGVDLTKVSVAYQKHKSYLATLNKIIAAGQAKMKRTNCF